MHLRRRYLSPALGQFISLDPLEVFNRYAYVNANPVNHVDPSGLLLGFGGGISGGGGSTTKSVSTPTKPKTTPVNTSNYAPGGGFQSGVLTQSPTKPKTTTVDTSNYAPGGGFQSGVLTQSSTQAAQQTQSGKPNLKTILSEGTTGRGRGRKRDTRREECFIIDGVLRCSDSDSDFGGSGGRDETCPPGLSDEQCQMFDRLKAGPDEFLVSACYRGDMVACAILRADCERTGYNWDSEACKAYKRAFHEDCDPYTYEPLKAAMEEACKEGLIMSCTDRSLRRLRIQLRKPGQKIDEVILTAEDIQRLIDNATRCINARQAIQDTCYRNKPDLTHATEIANVMGAMLICIALKATMSSITN